MAGGDRTDDQGPSLESVVSSLVIAATLILAFVLLAAGWEWFWIVFIIGFAGVLPMVPTFAAWYKNKTNKTSQSASTDERDPLETLRSRYARGDIDEAELERRLDALLETETATGGFETETERDPGRLSRALDTNTDTDTNTNTSTDTNAGADAGVERELDPSRE
jgi:uncharacterized membrane protein